MVRPLRLEFTGPLSHLSSQGDRREASFLTNSDREDGSAVVAQVCVRFGGMAHVYGRMTHRYHLLSETVGGNLTRCMRQLSGKYTQRINSCHGVVDSLNARPWSRYLCMIGRQVGPARLPNQLGENRTQAQQNYEAFVPAGRGARSPLSLVQRQRLLGDVVYVNQHQPPAYQALSPVLRVVSMPLNPAPFGGHTMTARRVEQKGSPVAAILTSH